MALWKPEAHHHLEHPYGGAPKEVDMGSGRAWIAKIVLQQP